MDEKDQVENKTEEVTMKGTVMKASKYLGSVRKRCLVLEGDCLKSYKDSPSGKPTEVLQLSRQSLAKADGNGSSVFRLSLATGQERQFTADNEEAAFKWVEVINRAAKYAGLQGALAKKNEDVERLNAEIESLEKAVSTQKTKMERTKTKHQENIEELLMVHTEELDRLGVPGKQSRRGTEQESEIREDDWVTFESPTKKDDQNELAGIVRYVGKGPHKKTHYGIETVDGCLGKHDGVVDAIRYFNAPKKAGIFVPREAITGKLPKYSLGDTVELDTQRTAIIRFIGRTKVTAAGATAYRWGLELIGFPANGNHDGKVGGTRYFTCQKKRGLMVPRKKILRIITKKRDKTFSTIGIKGKNDEPSSLELLNMLKLNLEQLDEQVVLPSSRSTLVNAHKNLDSLATQLRRHVITGKPNRIAFQNDLEEILQSGKSVSKKALGLAIFECRGLHTMKQSNAKDTLERCAEALDSLVGGLSDRVVENVKTKNKSKRANKIIIKGAAGRLYHFADFNHRFYLLMPDADKTFGDIAVKLVSRVKEKQNIPLVAGVVLCKNNESADSFELRCTVKLEKARDLDLQEVSQEV